MRYWSDSENQDLVKWHNEGMNTVEIAKKLSKKYGRIFSANSARMRYNRISAIKSDPPEKTAEDLIKEETARMRVRTDKRVIDMEVKRAAFNDLLLDVLRVALVPIKFVQQKIKQVQSKGSEAEEVVLDLSDLHFGKKTYKYDLKEAQRRFAVIVDSTMDIVNLHRNAYPIKVLNIIWGGDIVDGDSIYPTQSHHIDAHIVEQIFKSSETIVVGLAKLANFFDEVHNFCVRGNHGRISKFAHEDANFDNIMYQTLKMATINIPNMTWKIAQGWHDVIKIQNTRILIVHGHQIKMTLNLPWYGITTRIARWATTLGIGHFDVACMHHFHTSSRIRWNSKTVFTNGTMVSGDDFALEILGLESSECQWLFGIHPKRGVTWCYELTFL